MDKETKAVAIPISLVNEIEKKLKDSTFKSVEEYVADVLSRDLGVEPEPESSFTEDDEEKVRARLKALGYMD